MFFFFEFTRHKVRVGLKKEAPMMICTLNPDSRILIASGDSLLLDLLCEAIQLGGAEAIRAGSIQDALLMLKRKSIHAVVADSKMMDGSGVDLIRRIRSQGILIPGALMMGRDPEPAELALLSGDAEVVFRKPFGIDDFLAGLREMLDQQLPGLRFQAPLRPKGSARSAQWANRVVFDK